MGYPIVAGLEISGRVAALGPGVHGFAVGDRVAAFSEEAGGFAERCVVPAERLARIPDAMSLEVAASFPIQALTARTKGDLRPDKDKPINPTPAQVKADKEESQGVFVIANNKTEFRKLETGITSSTDIEVTSGLKEGDQIITGSYQVIRTIKNGTVVKVDNKPPVVKTTT